MDEHAFVIVKDGMSVVGKYEKHLQGEKLLLSYWKLIFKLDRTKPKRYNVFSNTKQLRGEGIRRVLNNS